MRQIIALTAILLYSAVHCQEKSWNWENDKPQEVSLEAEQNPEYVEDFQAAASEYTESNVQLNSTTADKVIDEILSSTRQGKALNGFDELYSDPSIQDVLQKGDEGEARNLIKDRLCYLGLMQCEDNIEGKRPYIAPEELVYAQPVAINPVGKPIPTIPVKGVRGGGGYGPPKPVPYPPSYSSGPPGKFGPPPSNKFGPPPSNKFGPPSSFSPPSNFGPINSGFSQNKPPRRHYGPPLSNKPSFVKPALTGEYYDSPEFLSKPPYPNGGDFIDSLPPYKFEQGAHQSAHHKDKRVEITVNAQGGAATASGGSTAGAPAVEHVHHHYHHNLEGANKPTVIVNPVPIAAAAVSTDLSSASNGFNTGFNPSAGLGGFSSSSGVLGSTIGGGGLSGGYYGGKPTVNYGSSAFGAIKPVSESYDSFGASVGSYGSSGLYKKELNLNSINNNYLQSGYADKYQGLESARAENYDCICVPYDQCPSHDVIGRKDDLYLPLDPRSLKSDIEAAPAFSEEDRVITDGNGTMTVVRVVKDVGLNATQLEATEKKVSKREAPADQKADSSEKTEGRQYGVNGLDMKKIKPTFGVSFGLPNQGGGGYPISPYGPNPLVNPYGGTIGGGGINLGLVSVNPLISVQVTKDDYGHKEIKPFVNLHVTPNNYLVHKFEDLLSYKKHVVFNKHKHYHLHKNPHYVPHYEHHPHHEHYEPPHYYSGPPSHSGPYIEHPPVHAPSYHPPDFHPPSYHPPDFHPPEHLTGESGGPYPEHYPGQGSYYDDPLNYGGGEYDPYYGRAYANKTNYVTGNSLLEQFQDQYQNGDNTYANNYNQDNNFNYNNHYDTYNQESPYSRRGKSYNVQNSPANPIKFPSSRKRRDVTSQDENPKHNITKRQFYGGNGGRPQTCGPRHVCCRRPYRPNVPAPQVNRQCGTRHSQGINGRIKNPVYVDGDSEFGEYPWQVAILKKDPKESVYVCGGTLIDPLHIITAAHCVKTYTGFDLRVRLGEWDVNHDVEFYPYIERDIVSVHVHPEFYAGTLYNDIAILRMDKPVDFSKYPHISPACLPHPQDDYSGTRCWTTGWGKDAFGDFGKYQNILKEVDVPILNSGICQRQLQNTRLGYDFKLHSGFICAGGEEGKDACKGDGGGPMVCERGGTWQVVGIVSWGIGCGQVGVPGVYVKVAYYLDWIRQITQRY